MAFRKKITVYLMISTSCSAGLFFTEIKMKNRKRKYSYLLQNFVGTLISVKR